MKSTIEKKYYPNFSRWVSSDDFRVWEKRECGWKFIGIAKSSYINDVMELMSHDLGHPEDIFTTD